MQSNETFLMQEESQIENYFSNKSIFITGATGFLGKILIEKLLRSCYSLKSIYVLVRMKKGKSPSERLDEIFNSYGLFDKVKQLYPNFKSKMIAIEGDLLEDELGLSEQDKQLLAENVNIIFHSAATVRFDEPLKVAVNINVIGTKKIIQLSKTLKNLEVIVHVSTAYANCDKKFITEEVFKPPVIPDKIVEAVDWVKEDVFQLLSDKMVHPRPNTYTFTKAIAEYMVFQEANNLPLAIVRPSIVGACWNEPLPGWLDNYNGPTGLFLAQNMGILRTMVGVKEAAADIIPVDVVINMMLAAAWFRGSERTKKLCVYNCTSDRMNRCTWNMIQNYSNKVSVKYPSGNMFYLPYFRFTKYRLIKNFNWFIEQIIPAFLADSLLKILHRKPRFIRIQSKLRNAVSVLENFSVMHLEFSTDNYLMLLNEMNQKDKETFRLDTRHLNWEEYIENYYLGIKRFLVKEDINKVKEYRNKYFKIKLVRNVLRLTILAIVVKILYKKSAAFKKLTNIFFFVILTLARRFISSKF